MQLSAMFTTLAFTSVTSIIAGLANTTPIAATSPEEEASYVVSFEQMQHWLASTTAELTFIGKPINPLAPRTAEYTIVTYCATLFGEQCQGPCTVYSGGPTCLSAPSTNCLTATTNVVFCSSTECVGNCTALSSCFQRLSDGYCSTPGTQSIKVNV